MNDPNVIQMLSAIMNKLEDIEGRLSKIEKVSECIQHSTANMDRHISFVEIIYDTIKFPLGYIVDKIQSIHPYGYTPTPHISFIMNK